MNDFVLQGDISLDFLVEFNELSLVLPEGGTVAELGYVDQIDISGTPNYSQQVFAEYRNVQIVEAKTNEF